MGDGQCVKSGDYYFVGGAESMAKLKVLDLFSGIGGISLGLEWTGGFETIAFCEIDPNCHHFLANNWPDVPIFDDIKTLDPLKLTSSVDIIVGGFPCQDISCAGKGAGLSGERSGLYWHMHELVRTLRPRFILFENVPNLRTRGADQILTALEQEGYAVAPLVVGAWAVNAPHQRNRAWLVGYRLADSLHNGRRIGGELPSQQERERKAMEWVQLGKESGDRYSTGLVADPNGTGRREQWGTSTVQPQQPPIKRYRPAYFPSRPAVEQEGWEPDRLVEPEVGSSPDGLPNRVARLKALGNAVVPQVVEAIGYSILAMNEVYF